jgi:hypothetical protein
MDESMRWVIKIGDRILTGQNGKEIRNKNKELFFGH